MSGYMNTAKSVEWETPRDLFDRLNEVWRFDLDVASSHANALCESHYTAEDDGLAQDWGGHRCWMNTPYGRVLADWVEKAYRESQKPGTIVVALIPARTDTRWFHEYVANGRSTEYTLLKGRLKFAIDGVPQQSATFPSMLVRWGGRLE